MSTEIRIPIPEAADIGVDGLVEWFRSRIETLSGALDLGVKEFDRKAKIDSIVIEAVEASDSTVEVTYRVSFSASDTCRGIDYAGNHQRMIRGVIDGNAWVFQPPKPLPTRSTADEL